MSLSKQAVISALLVIVYVNSRTLTFSVTIRHAEQNGRAGGGVEERGERGGGRGVSRGRGPPQQYRGGRGRLPVAPRWCGPGEEPSASVPLVTRGKTKTRGPACPGPGGPQSPRDVGPATHERPRDTWGLQRWFSHERGFHVGPATVVLTIGAGYVSACGASPAPQTQKSIVSRLELPKNSKKTRKISKNLQKNSKRF